MIIPFSDLAKLREKYKDKKIVTASGVFDLLHVGHVQYLQILKDYGDITVVIVKPDARIKRHKHANRPIIPEMDRAEMVDAIKGVDYVVVGSHTPDAPAKIDAMYEEFFTQLQPDVYVATNEDWNKLAEVTEAEVISLPRTAAGHFRSTTAIINHIHQLDSF